MGVNPDELLAVLADAERRTLLRELDDGPRTVAELGAALAAADDARDEADAATSVVHVHVPKLEGVGLVALEGDLVVPRIDTDGATPAGERGTGSARRA